MALVALDGSLLVPIGPGFNSGTNQPTNTTTTLDATNEALIFVGQIVTSDGASHTIDTTGSSSIGWRTASVTFANGGTTVKVGLAAVDTTNGPPVRAAHASDVITFDVNAAFTGGGGGITANAWQTSVPTAGTKTVANGDFIAMAVQMTARGGADSIQVAGGVTDQTYHRPAATQLLSSTYTALGRSPIAIITFSDGALGYFYGSNVSSTQSSRTWNSGSATKEYGQLYKLPFPVNVYGLYGWAAPTADFDIVLYSDPLGTPVAEKTISMDSNAVANVSGARFSVLFASPYTTTADQNIGAVFKPGASNITAYYRTLASATHRIVDPWGTEGYGISRASGAFGDANSSLDHYYIGLLVGAFDNGAGGGGGGVSRARSNGGVALC